MIYPFKVIVKLVLVVLSSPVEYSVDVVKLSILALNWNLPCSPQYVFSAYLNASIILLFCSIFTVFSLYIVFSPRHILKEIVYHAATRHCPQSRENSGKTKNYIERGVGNGLWTFTVAPKCQESDSTGNNKGVGGWSPDPNEGRSARWERVAKSGTEHILRRVVVLVINSRNSNNAMASFSGPSSSVLIYF